MELKKEGLINESTELYRALVNEATVNAIKYMKNEEKERQNKKYDRRLHNTELLLRNYANIKEHMLNAVYTEDQLKIDKVETELDKEEGVDTVYINSILKTRKRSEIMIEQIDRSLEYYKFKCLDSKREDVQRRIDVIELLYIKSNLSFDEVAEKIHVDPRTVSRTRKEAIKDIAPLLFGIDGIDLY